MTNKTEKKSTSMITIYSTLSNDQSFPTYIKGKGKTVAAAKIKTAILIKGGAHVANKHHITSKFAETQITSEDLKVLEDSPAFNRMVERGFFTMQKPTEIKKDKSAPLIEKDIKAKNAKAIVITNDNQPE
jgi:hypothetical protein